MGSLSLSIQMAQTCFENFETLQKCPMCSGTRFALFSEPDIQRCPDCGLFFNSPRPTQTDIAASYNSDAVYKEWDTTAEYHKRQFKIRLGHILPFVDSGRLLDVGAGNGLFMEVAADAGFKCEGTELSDTGTGRTRKRGFEISQGQLTDIDFGSKRFDVVSMWHVLEHVPNPGEVTKKVFDILEPGGVFALAVPNETRPLFRHQWNKKTKLWMNAWGHEIHLSHFLPKTLRKSLEKTGFEVLDFGMDDIYNNTSLRSAAVVTIHQISAHTIRWHFGVAMYFIARKPKV